MSTWYYAIDGQRYGPVSLAELQAQATAGRLTATDSVWTDGWPDWRPATAVPELRLGPTPVVTPASPVPLQTVAYQTSAGSSMPDRAARALVGYGPPTGDVGEWPLDDTRVAQFVEASRQRRRVRRAFGMYRSLCVLLAAAAVMFGGVALLPGARGIAPAATVGVTGVAILFAVLYGLAARATRLNHKWGGYVIVGLLAVSSAINLGSALVSVISDGRDVMLSVFGNGFALLLNAAFLVTAVRGIRGITGFRASPAWCQEVLIRSEAKRRATDL